MRYYLIILLGIVAASFAAIFIRIADEAPALIIAAYRLGIASLIMTPYAAQRVHRQWQNYSQSTLRWNLLSGVFLAFHFATWIASLKYTSVASSVVLVTTNPLWVSILGWLFLKEKPRIMVWLGILLSLIGTLIMAWGGLMQSESNFLGNMLALAGAFFASLYFLTGRHLRQSISATVYSYITYSTAAVILVLIALVTGLPWTGYSPTTYTMFLLLAIVPQIIGHTSFNYALRYVPAVIVAVAILGEPIGASTLAWLLLGEPVTLPTIIGGVCILLGVFLAVYTREKKSN